METFVIVGVCVTRSVVDSVSVGDPTVADALLVRVAMFVAEGGATIVLVIVGVPENVRVGDWEVSEKLHDGPVEVLDNVVGNDCEALEALSEPEPECEEERNEVSLGVRESEGPLLVVALVESSAPEAESVRDPYMDGLCVDVRLLDRDQLSEVVRDDVELPSSPDSDSDGLDDVVTECVGVGDSVILERETSRVLLLEKSVGLTTAMAVSVFVANDEIVPDLEEDRAPSLGESLGDIEELVDGE